ncbi:MAG: HDOD domain-containing protein [Desulfobacterales bacterium]|nr:MAG: HDOD domain-containing protein [Desulfobacterales bacterium]
MRVECPNCRMISAVDEDRIVTAQNAFHLSCPTCRFSMMLHLRSTLGGTGSPSDLQNLSEQQLASGSPEKDAKTQRRITALKAKILRSLVNLPPMPHIILKARDILSDPDSSLKDLAKVIEIDQALVAKVLTLANSAYYGVSGMVSSIQHASVLLGQKTLGQMITISASSVLLNKKLRGYDIAPDDMWKHSLACAFAAKRIAETYDDDLIEDAFTAGLLHDAGKIILDPYVIKRKDEFKQFAGQKNMPFFEAEKAVFGFDHAEIMSRACRLWRFPETQVAAIRYHHQPACHEDNELACMIYLADVLAKSAGFTAGQSASLEQIAPEILKFLRIQAKDLDIVTAGVRDDLQKIKDELKEG